MAQYRAFTIGDDGHFISYRAFTCVNDAEAIVWASSYLTTMLWSFGAPTVSLSGLTLSRSRSPRARHAKTRLRRLSSVRPAWISRHCSQHECRQIANLHRVHAIGVRLTSRLRIVTAPSSTVVCSACMIGLTVYDVKRPCIGNLSTRLMTLWSRTSCLSWRLCV